MMSILEPACRLHKIGVSDRTLDAIRATLRELRPGHPLEDELRLLRGRWDQAEAARLEDERKRNTALRAA